MTDARDEPPDLVLVRALLAELKDHAPGSKGWNFYLLLDASLSYYLKRLDHSYAATPVTYRRQLNHYTYLASGFLAEYQPTTTTVRTDT